MLLQRLSEFADSGRFEAPPTFYTIRPIRYLIDLDTTGRPLGRSPVDTSDPNRPGMRRGVPRMAPFLVRSKGVRPLLLSDNGEYTLGVRREGSNQERVSERHAAYVELVDRCSQATGLASMQAVSRFFHDGGVKRLDLGTGFDAAAVVTFRVNAEFPMESPLVRRFWAEVAADVGVRELQCLVCGEKGAVLNRLQKKVKEIPRGHPAGTSLVSAHSSVFESYGLKNNQIAPTCAECAEKFTESVNHLLSDPDTHIGFPSTKLILWSGEKPQMDWVRVLTSPEDSDVRELAGDRKAADSRYEHNEDSVYGLVLSANGARAVVRAWIETTVGDLKESLCRWFDAQTIVDAHGEADRPLGIYSLAGATVRHLSDVPATVTTYLSLSALTGAPLPLEALHRAVVRNRAERRVTRPRAALIRMVLLSRDDESYRDDYMVGLERNDRRPAYLCGRLLHMLENTQRTAIRNVKDTIVDTYFCSASTVPASVFPSLLTRSRFQVSKVRRQNMAAYRTIQSLISDVMRDLPEFPMTLTLEEQGLFALGYYHQRAHHIKQILARGPLIGHQSQFPDGRTGQLAGSPL